MRHYAAGLGKTFIAAVVMFNFYRWFPDGGKVIFVAPTRPLVDQQRKACHGITGIPAADTHVLVGNSKKDEVTVKAVQVDTSSTPC